MSTSVPAVIVAVVGSLTASASGVSPWLLLGWGALVALLPAGRRVVLVAIAVRVPLLFLDPVYSDDVYRYVWEGRVWAAGWSPFALAPDAPALTPLRDNVWAHVNHRHVPSIYPPLAQLLFWLLAPGGVIAWKLVAGACDVVTAWLLARRRPEAGWLWAALPLPALESAGSGHLEGIGVMLAVLALRGSAVAAWAGAMVKLLPGVLVPRRYWGLAALATVVAFLPLLGPGLTEGFETYRTTWAFNASLGGLPRPVLQAAGFATVAWVLWRSRDVGRIALWTFGAFVILSPTVHPWYVLWPLAAGLWTGLRAWTVLAVLVPVSYEALRTYDGVSWVEPAWPRWIEYPPFFAVLLWEGWRRLTRAGPWPVH